MGQSVEIQMMWSCGSVKAVEVRSIFAYKLGHYRQIWISVATVKSGRRELVRDNDILMAIESLATQQKSLIDAVTSMKMDNAQLRSECSAIIDRLEDVLSERDDDLITWTADVIAGKTGVSPRVIKKAMRKGELPCVQIHKRGKGYVRVASPDQVVSWLQKESTRKVKPKPSGQSHRRKRKPPNIVF